MAAKQLTADPGIKALLDLKRILWDKAIGYWLEAEHLTRGDTQGDPKAWRKAEGLAKHYQRRAELVEARLTALGHRDPEPTEPVEF